MRQVTEEDEFEALPDALHQEFSDVVPTVDEVRRVVGDVLDRYRDARAREFVPILVYRDTRETLRPQRRTTCSQGAPGP